MSEEDTSFIQKQIVKVNYWKLALWKLISGSLIVAIATLVPTLSTQTWKDLDGQGKFLIILGVLLAVLRNIESFLDKTMSNLTAKAPPPEPPKPS